MTLKSEDDFLELLNSHFPNKGEGLHLGRGDDCAVIKAEKDLCVSTDLFLEDVHFRRSYFSAADIGYKALAVNISDITAMGARPLAFTLDIMIPKGLDHDFWDSLFGSMAALARQNDMVLAGGDLSRAEKLGISICIWGIPGPGGNFIQRKQGKTGDILFLCGDVGLARVGLLSLEDDPVKAKDDFPQSIAAHLRPKPKVMVSTLISAAGVTSLMDVSDGLARDIPRLLPEGCGADIVLDKAELHHEVKQYSEAAGKSAVETAMLGGEDYALLGSADESTFAEKVASIPGIKKIGTITEKQGIRVNGSAFTTSGFDHFG